MYLVEHKISNVHYGKNAKMAILNLLLFGFIRKIIIVAISFQQHFHIKQFLQRVS
jgi:hypothetical protein